MASCASMHTLNTTITKQQFPPAVQYAWYILELTQPLACNSATCSGSVPTNELCNKHYYLSFSIKQICKGKVLSVLN